MRAQAVGLVVLSAVVLGAAAGAVLSRAPAPSAATQLSSLWAPSTTSSRTAGTSPPTNAVAGAIDGGRPTGPFGDSSTARGVTSRIVSQAEELPGAEARSDPVATPDWADVLGKLDDLRTEAFARGDATLLSSVYVAGSEPLARDVATITSLSRSGLRASGLRLELDDVVLEHVDPDVVVLQVVDRLSAHRLIRADGSVAQVRDGRGPQTWLVTLERDGNRWLVAAITPAGDPS